MATQIGQDFTNCPNSAGSCAAAVIDVSGLFDDGLSDEARTLLAAMPLVRSTRSPSKVTT
jgi:hypothetical protein